MTNAATISGFSSVPAFSAYQSSAQSVSSGTWTKVQFQTKEFDTNSNFDNITNYRFTPTVAGYYQITSGISTNGQSSQIYVGIYKNGSLWKRTGIVNSAPDGITMSVLVYCNGTTDYIETYTYIGTSLNLAASSNLTFFQGCLIRGA
jgi:hypothetical protein